MGEINRGKREQIRKLWFREKERERKKKKKKRIEQKMERG